MDKQIRCGEVPSGKNMEDFLGRQEKLMLEPIPEGRERPAGGAN